jgi:alkylhydroperoxidase family enzyme
MSVRRAVARPVGAGDLLEDVRRYEQSDLPEHQKAALRLADAFLAYPAGFRGDATAATLAHFSPSQVVELALKLVWWSSNKVTITLGADAPYDDDRLTTYHYADDGTFVVHEPAG